MYKHKVFAVAVNILPIHQSIYTVYALAPTRLPTTICIAVAMALTSPCKHKCCSGIGANKASYIDKWTRFCYSNCYKNQLNETAMSEFTVICVDRETQTTAETKNPKFW